MKLSTTDQVQQQLLLVNLRLATAELRIKKLELQNKKLLRKIRILKHQQ